MKRLKYVSQFSRYIPPEEIHDIVEKASVNNAKLDISGLLMSGDNLFFQILEGPDERVTDLYNRICRDDRHIQVMTVSDEPIEERLFSTWGMRNLDIASEEQPVLEPVRSLLRAVMGQRTSLNQLMQRHAQRGLDAAGSPLTSQLKQLDDLLTGIAMVVYTVGDIEAA